MTKSGGDANPDNFQGGKLERRDRRKPRELSANQFRDMASDTAQTISLLSADYSLLYQIAHEQGRRGESSGSSSGVSSPTEATVLGATQVRDLLSDVSEALKTAHSKAISARSFIDRSYAILEKRPASSGAVVEAYTPRLDKAKQLERQARDLRASEARSEKLRKRAEAKLAGRARPSKVRDESRFEETLRKARETNAAAEREASA
jgi:hypothetical protein